MCSAVQQTDPLGTRDPPPVNTTGTRRGLGLGQYCVTCPADAHYDCKDDLDDYDELMMYVSRIYLIGIKILS